MIETREQLGALSAICIGAPDAPRTVVMLHGREMEAADLAPFGHSITSSGGGDARWIFPDAPLPSTRARTWWPTDSEQRMRNLAEGPMELSAMDPPGRAEARVALGSLLATISTPVVLAGFSQGGMLAMDVTLHGYRPAALALLSSTRIALADWQPRAAMLASLRVLVAHGHDDRELSFTAGELLRDFAVAGGADVTWLPFDGGHDLPLVVWRALKKLLR